MNLSAFTYIVSRKITSPLECILLEKIIKEMIDDGEKIIGCQLIPNGYEILIERQCRSEIHGPVIIRTTPGSVGLAFSN